MRLVLLTRQSVLLVVVTVVQPWVVNLSAVTEYAHNHAHTQAAVLHVVMEPAAMLRVRFVVGVLVVGLSKRAVEMDSAAARVRSAAMVNTAVP